MGEKKTQQNLPLKGSLNDMQKKAILCNPQYHSSCP
jgi:hypothetical protein